MSYSGDGSRKRGYEHEGPPSCLRSPSRRRTARHDQQDVLLNEIGLCGCYPSETGQNFKVADPRVLQQQLEEHFRADKDLKQQFLEGLQAYVDDPENLLSVLAPLWVTDAGSAPVGDSLARVLLHVRALQAAVANLLLEKLPEHMGDEDEDTFHGGISADRGSIPQLIVKQFQWLEYLHDSRALTEKFLEVLQISPLYLKKEIISMLPEMIIDADHELVVEALEAMLSEDTRLIVPVLECYSNLNLHPDSVEKVVLCAINCLSSAQSDDLPVVVKFLLESATTINAKCVVLELRKNLTFTSATDNAASAHKKKMKEKALSSMQVDGEALVLEALRSGLQYNKVMADAFVKEIRALDSADEHRVLDILVILVLCSIGGQLSKTAEAVLRRKVTVGLVTQALLRRTMQGRSGPLRELLPTLLNLGDSFIRGNEEHLRGFGCWLYELTFLTFEERYPREEVIGALTAHIGSGKEEETSSGLAAMASLAAEQTSALHPVYGRIAGILDYLDMFKVEQIHQVYNIFSRLSVFVRSPEGVASRASSTVSDELMIIIRKQVTHVEPKYRQMGVIGAVQLASQLAASSGSPALSGSDEPADEAVTDALDLLGTVVKSARLSPQLQAFLYDELAATVESKPLQPQMLHWLHKEAMRFQTYFLKPAELIHGGEEDWTFGNVKGELWLDLEGHRGTVQLCLLPCLTAKQASGGGPESLLYLPSMFNFLAVVLMGSSSLAAIDGLLGCAVILPHHELLEDPHWDQLSQKQQELICIAFAHTINWIREVVNVFSAKLELDEAGRLEASSKGMAEKLVKRLRMLMHMEQLLMELMGSVPELQLPHSQLPVGGGGVGRPPLGPGGRGGRGAGRGPGRSGGRGGAGAEATGRQQEAGGSSNYPGFM